MASPKTLADQSDEQVEGKKRSSNQNNKNSEERDPEVRVKEEGEDEENVGSVLKPSKTYGRQENLETNKNNNSNKNHKKMANYAYYQQVPVSRDGSGAPVQMQMIQTTGPAMQDNTVPTFAVVPPTTVATPHQLPLTLWKRQLSERGSAQCVHPGCQINYLSLAGVVAHYNKCDGQAREGFYVPCQCCGLRFNQFKSMQKHMAKAHNAVLAPPQRPQQQQQQQVMQPAPQMPYQQQQQMLPAATTITAMPPQQQQQIIQQPPMQQQVTLHEPPQQQQQHSFMMATTPSQDMHSYSRMSSGVDAPAPGPNSVQSTQYIPEEIVQSLSESTETGETPEDTSARIMAESRLISNPRRRGRPSKPKPDPPAAATAASAAPITAQVLIPMPVHMLNQQQQQQHPQVKVQYDGEMHPGLSQPHVQTIQIKGQNYIVSRAPPTATVTSNSMSVSGPLRPTAPPPQGFIPLKQLASTPMRGPPPALSHSSSSPCGSTSAASSSQAMRRPGIPPSPASTTLSSSVVTASAIPHQDDEVQREQQAVAIKQDMSELEARERELEEQEAKLQDYERLVLQSERLAEEAKKARLEQREVQMKKRQEELRKRLANAVQVLEDTKTPQEQAPQQQAENGAEANSQALDMARNRMTPPESSTEQVDEFGESSLEDSASMRDRDDSLSMSSVSCSGPMTSSRAAATSVQPQSTTPAHCEEKQEDETCDSDVADKESVVQVAAAAPPPTLSPPPQVVSGRRLPPPNKKKGLKMLMPVVRYQGPSENEEEETKAVPQEREEQEEEIVTEQQREVEKEPLEPEKSKNEDDDLVATAKVPETKEVANEEAIMNEDVPSQVEPSPATSAQAVPSSSSLSTIKQETTKTPITFDDDSDILVEFVEDEVKNKPDKTSEHHEVVVAGNPEDKIVEVIEAPELLPVEAATKETEKEDEEEPPILESQQEVTPTPSAQEVTNTEEPPVLLTEASSTANQINICDKEDNTSEAVVPATAVEAPKEDEKKASASQVDDPEPASTTSHKSNPEPPVVQKRRPGRPKKQKPDANAVEPAVIPAAPEQVVDTDGRPRRSRKRTWRCEENDDSAPKRRPGRSAEPKILEEQRSDLENVAKEEESNVPDDEKMLKKTRKSRKRKQELPVEVDDELEPASVSATPQDNLVLPVAKKSRPGRKGRKTVQEPDVDCGKCDMVGFHGLLAFQEHAALVHGCLARPKGESQEFSDVERDEQVRLGFANFKKVICFMCLEKVYSTRPGLMYHIRSCGKTKEEIQNEKITCSYCNYRGQPDNVYRHEQRDCLRRRIVEKEQQAAEESAVPELTPSGRTKRRAASKATAKVQEAISFLKKRNDADTVDSNKPEDLENSGDEDDTYNVAEELNLKHSYRQVRVERRRNYACKLCAEVFDKRKAVEEHLLRSHQQELHQEDEEEYSEKQLAEEEDEEDDDEGIDEDLIAEEEEGEVPDDDDDVSVDFCRPRVKRFERAKPLEPCVDMIRTEFAFRKEHFNQHAFEGMHSRLADWVILSADESKNYLPPVEKSMPFSSRINTDSSENDKTPVSLPRFGASSDKKSTSIFVGGPIWAADWLPTSDASAGNYLVLCADLDLEDIKLNSSPPTNKGLIQIWKFSDDFSDAECKLCIPHEFGKIGCLRWCPSGNVVTETPSSDQLPRLGVLSASCADGNVHLFSVCIPESLPRGEDGGPVFARTKPSLSLISTAPEFNQSRQCLKHAWSRRSGHRVIAAAFSDGSFSLWDLHSDEDSILRMCGENTLLPFRRVDDAHASSVNGIDLSDGGQGDMPSELVTGSTDRVCSIWNVKEFPARASRPRQSIKRGLVTDVTWLRHHPGQVAVSFDDVFLQSHTHSVVYEFSDGANRTHPVIAQNSAVWEQSYNPWLNVLLAATATGELIVFVGPPVEKALEHDKETKKRRAYVYRTEVISDEKESSSQDAQEMDEEQLRPKELRYVDMVADVQTAPLEELKRAWYPEKMGLEDLTQEPVASLNRVAQNTNLHALGWVFSGGFAGIGRVQKVAAVSGSDVRRAVNKVLKK